MATDSARSSSSANPTDAGSDTSPEETLIANRPVWWLKVLQVRFRFLLIVLLAAGFVSQWRVVRSVWDRWQWSFHSRQSAGAVSSGQEYFCPMDPGVLSAWPAICPICNMDLVPRKKMDAVLLPEGVVARMQLTPYRIQLAGIRTTAVEPRELNYELTFTGVLQTERTEGEDSSVRIGFEVSLSPTDAAFFDKPRSAEVKPLGATEPSVRATAQLATDNGPRTVSAILPRLQITLDETATLPVGTAVTATITIPAVELIAEQSQDDSSSPTGDVLAVPESAVVDRGSQRLVYVETMPGMFDGVAVEVGRRCGAFYPVQKGLKSGQRVATAGAFLIDAETRLNPSLAAGYFGANQSGSPSATPVAPQPTTIAPATGPLTKAAPPKKPLSPEDQALADKQRICPVTDLPLNSMGGPLPVMVAGRKVFICCAGCEGRLKSEPDKYLAKLPAP